MLRNTSAAKLATHEAASARDAALTLCGVAAVLAILACVWRVEHDNASSMVVGAAALVALIAAGIIAVQRLAHRQRA